jgi:hypothetical protein
MNSDSQKISDDQVQVLKKAIDDMLSWQKQDDYRKAWTGFSHEVNDRRLNTFTSYQKSLEEEMKAYRRRHVSRVLRSIQTSWERIRDALIPGIIPSEKFDSTRKEIESALDSLIDLWSGKRKQETKATDTSLPPGDARRGPLRARPAPRPTTPGASSHFTLALEATSRDQHHL